MIESLGYVSFHRVVHIRQQFHIIKSPTLSFHSIVHGFISSSRRPRIHRHRLGTKHYRSPNTGRISAPARPLFPINFSFLSPQTFLLSYALER